MLTLILFLNHCACKQTAPVLPEANLPIKVHS